MSLVLLGAFGARRTGIYRHHRLTDGLTPYLASLRAVAPDVRVVFFNHAGDEPALCDLLARFHVESVPGPMFDRARSIVAVQPENRRFLEYGAWLREHPHDEVIVTDLFDVVWQRHPSTLFPTTGLLVAQENQVIKQCPINWRVVRWFWPEAMSARIGERRVVCCGAFAGTGEAMGTYLSHYAATMPPPERERPHCGWDTGCLAEWLAREPTATPVTTLPWVNEQIMHLGYCPTDRVRWTNGRIEACGVVPTLVHQYLGHPEAVAGVRARWI